MSVFYTLTDRTLRMGTLACLAHQGGTPAPTFALPAGLTDLAVVITYAADADALSCLKALYDLLNTHLGLANIDLTVDALALVTLKTQASFELYVGSRIDKLTLRGPAGAFFQLQWPRTQATLLGNVTDVTLVLDDDRLAVFAVGYPLRRIRAVHIDVRASIVTLAALEAVQLAFCRGIRFQGQPLVTYTVTAHDLVGGSELDFVPPRCLGLRTDITALGAELTLPVVVGKMTTNAPVGPDTLVACLALDGPGQESVFYTGHAAVTLLAPCAAYAGRPVNIYDGRDLVSAICDFTLASPRRIHHQLVTSNAALVLGKAHGPQGEPLMLLLCDTDRLQAYATGEVFRKTMAYVPLGLALASNKEAHAPEAPFYVLDRLLMALTAAEGLADPKARTKAGERALKNWLKAWTVDRTDVTICVVTGVPEVPANARAPCVIVDEAPETRFHDPSGSDGDPLPAKPADYDDVPFFDPTRVHAPVRNLVLGPDGVVTVRE